MKCNRCMQPSDERVCKWCSADYYEVPNLNKQCPDCQDLMGILEYHDETIKYVCRRCKTISTVEQLTDKIMSKTHARY